MSLPNVIALRHTVPAIRLDPLSMRPIDQVPLPPGTLIEGAAEALARAASEEAATVIVRVRFEDGLIGFREVSTPALREAIEQRV
jgi:hypothetical protein